MTPKGKTAQRRNGGDSTVTRKAILDATARIMRENGHAAVSSRRVAEAAGLKSQLVHYHFGTMDDLFLALFRRSEEEYLGAEVRALTSADPVRRLWESSMATDKELVAEFIALAIHHQPIRDEIARSNDRTRAMHAALFAKAMTQAGIDCELFPPEVIAFLVAAISRTLLTESALGVSSGHQATRSFVERWLAKLEPNVA